MNELFHGNPNTTESMSNSNGSSTQTLSGIRQFLALIRGTSQPQRTYNVGNGQNPSVVFIGMRGSGKSTLAVIASAILKYQVIDLNLGAFANANGLESQLLKQQLQELKQKENVLIKECLTENTSGCVIVLPPTFLDYEPTVNFLIEYGMNHPIIHIECEESRILSYIGFDGALENGLNWVRRKLKTYQYCSHFDYFNVKSDTESTSQMSFPKFTSGINVLALKPAEEDLTSFLSFILWGKRGSDMVLKPLECTLHSSAVRLNFPEILDNDLRINDLVIGADAVELTINLVEFLENGMPLKSINEFVARVRHSISFNFPIIISVDFDLNEQGLQNIGQFKRAYLDILLSSIRLGVNYLVLDLALAQDNVFMSGEEGYKILKQFVNNRYRTKIIGAYHFAHKREFWSTSLPFDIYSLAKNLGCNIVKITKVATKFSENLDAQQFVRDCSNLGDGNLKVAAYNTGKIGQFSKVLNPIISSTVPVFKVERSVDNALFSREALCQQNISDDYDKITACDLNRSLYYCFMLPVLSYFVIGSKITNSLSPAVHNAAYDAIGLPHRCYLFQTTEIEDIEKVLRRPDFGGACVIMPYKLQVLGLVDEMSEHVRRIGAINTIVTIRSPDADNTAIKVRGENTDWLGIRKVINVHSSPFNSAQESRSALVLGAGGMSRASLYALISMGISKIFLYNRTRSKAVELANHFNEQSPLSFSDLHPHVVDFNIQVIESLEQVAEYIRPDFTSPTVIVNCIPCKDALTGKKINVDLPDFWFDSTSGGVFVETGYEPLVTPLIKKARTYVGRGWIATTGLDYLHAQAVPQIEMHTGKIAPEELIKNVIMNQFAAHCM